jgi:hypothetical protein
MISTRRRSPARFAKRRLRYCGVPPHPNDRKKNQIIISHLLYIKVY